ncbi:hypothetical protein IW261DRAFT_1336744, partial [Armillaria novae-zelandiae]
YTGNNGAIPSTFADIPCADLGVDGVFKKLEATLSVSDSFGLGFDHSILKPYVARNDNFGTVYSHLRRYWYVPSINVFKWAFRSEEERDTMMREMVFVHGRIRTRRVPPRRVSRGSSRLWAISHAWVDDNDRVNVMTPINGYEWPVPMPKDANLDLIRIEMLNHGAEFAWLDVLCLRQEGGKGEHLRLEEWKLDVPTIGWVYSDRARVVCYFNGLGRPLHLTRDYFESDRCWFRRAWTLQEITDDVIIGGETGDDIIEKEVRQMFDERLACLRQLRKRGSCLDLVSEMRTRVSSKPLDKVAGLAYLLNLDCIPIYDAEMSDANAWEVLLDAMSSWSRAELFFYFPEPGNGKKYWRPSWQQIMTMKHCQRSSFLSLGRVRVGDRYEGCFINSADVRGLDEGLEEEEPRQGEIFFENPTGVSCTFKISADHSYPIPNGSYALVGARHWYWGYPVGPWVVGRLKKVGEFEKLSVFSLADDELIKIRKLRLDKVKISLC